MGTTMKFYQVLFCANIALCVWGQNKVDAPSISNGFLEGKWEEYRYYAKENLGMIPRFFRDTISVEEMVKVFQENQCRNKPDSPFADFDSIADGIYGKQLLLTSPLRSHSLKRVHDKRGIWSWGKGFVLQQLLDSAGHSQEKLLKKVNAKAMLWENGDFLTLRSPQNYMGLIISPRPYLSSYRDGKLIARYSVQANAPDYFSFTAPCRWLDAEWHHYIEGGERLMGRLLNLYTDYTNANTLERTFSVLLYERNCYKSQRGSYTLELLLPRDADTETLQSFNIMKTFVENLPPRVFSPYFTADFRILTGRYYRVTVNRCGWLVEDYLLIKK